LPAGGASIGNGPPLAPLDDAPPDDDAPEDDAPEDDAPPLDEVGLGFGFASSPDEQLESTPTAMATTMTAGARRSERIHQGYSRTAHFRSSGASWTRTLRHVSAGWAMRAEPPRIHSMGMRSPHSA
jgi:hypothetical protein